MVRRLEAHQLPRKHRTWTGNDGNGRHHHGKTDRIETHCFVRLSWKESRDAVARFTGCYELDMICLLAAGYIRADGLDDFRLRFVHADDGGIYIQANSEGPRLRVDTLTI